MMPLPRPALRRAANAIKRLWLAGGHNKATASDNAAQVLNALEVSDLISLARTKGVELGRLGPKPKAKRHDRPE